MSGINNWQPNTLYPPGSVVLPNNQNVITTQQPDNNDFTDGLSGWTASAEFGSGDFTVTDTTYVGSQAVQFAGAEGTGPNHSVYAFLENNYLAPVTPGQVIKFYCYVSRKTAPSNTSYCNGGCFIQWLDASENVIGTSLANTQHNNTVVNACGNEASETPCGMVGGVSAGEWVQNTGAGTAPANAAYAQFCVVATGNTTGATVTICGCSWDYSYRGYPTGLIFVAVQATPGLSGSVEPTWPTTVTGSSGSVEEIVDNQVVWEAEYASRIVWQAQSILVSGSAEPDWSTIPGTLVNDNDSISWVCSDGRVTDTNCPNTKQVAITSAKVFAANGSTVGFCATNNPLDWTSSNDAGFLPTGMNNYGTEPAAALGLYRGNLLVFNSLGYQMWQTDPDPTNMALLDAEPVGSQAYRSGQPVNDDFVFLSPVGIRNIGFAGASGNLQAGEFGKQIDPLVVAAMNADTTTDDPLSCFVPGLGQYWLIFNLSGAESDETEVSGANSYAEIFVLTMNANPGSQLTGGNQSWSRYELPDTVTDVTVLDGLVYLRTGTGKVWMVDPTVTQDDYYCDPSPPVLTGTIAGDGAKNQASLSWTAATSNDNSPIGGYYIYNDSSGTPTLVDTVSASTLAYGAGSLADFQTFAFYVTAFTNAGALEQSNTLALTSGGPQATTLSGALNSDETEVTLDWPAGTTTGGAVTGYNIYDATTGDLLETISDPSTTSWTQDVTGDGPFAYYITVTSDTAESTESNTVSLSADTITLLYTTPGTATLDLSTYNPSTVDFYLIGGGAGGAGAEGDATGFINTATAGGGGGAYTAVQAVAADALTDTLTIVVGAGGAGGTVVTPPAGDGTGAGADGGTTSITGSDDTVYATAPGGTCVFPADESWVEGDLAGNGAAAGVINVSGTDKVTQAGASGCLGWDYVESGSGLAPGAAGANGAPGGGAGSAGVTGDGPTYTPTAANVGGAGSGTYGGAGGNSGYVSESLYPTYSAFQNTAGESGAIYGGGGGGAGAGRYASGSGVIGASGGAGAGGVVVVVLHI